MQNTQEATQRTPPIILSLVGAQSPNNSIPIVYKPLKDNGTTEFRPNRLFEANLFSLNQNYRQRRSAFEIKLPYPNARSTTTADSISSKPYSPQEFPSSILFSNESLSMVFSNLLEEHQIQISPESIAEIFNIITHQLYEILTRAAQSSRQRTNVYAPPISEREITSAPKIKQNFLEFETVFANKIRKNLFNGNNIDENDPYEPYYFENFDAKKADLFTEPSSNERNEQMAQMRRIFQTLRARGEMFKTVANETDSSFSFEIDKCLKNDKISLGAKPNGFSPKANEIFGGAEDEKKKKKDRKITPKDIFEALSRMSFLYQSEIPLWRLKYFEKPDSDND
ncbi:hypothetical protein M9Y10_017962 [Tritrichomonas musculus]|uniref:Uncharacterized protein n=1 Tax=Tritrichomonas musculus TaxID=1915356 RepID=A0ABR2HUV4_9EUKA